MPPFLMAAVGDDGRKGRIEDVSWVTLFWRCLETTLTSEAPAVPDQGSFVRALPWKAAHLDDRFARTDDRNGVVSATAAPVR
jgi:hypothetical protein